MATPTVQTQASARSKALSNIDILGEIFATLQHPHSGIEGYEEEVKNREPVGIEEQALARAARVCKTFTHPALRALWSSLPSLFPLWHLLEPSFQAIGPDIAGDPIVNFKYIMASEIPPKMWARFRKYARLIRDIRDDEVSGACIDQSFWMYLTRQLQGQPLLPRIQSLTYAIINPYEASLLVILSPSLRRVVLHFAYFGQSWGPRRGQEAAIDMLMRAVCKESPQVSTVMLSLLEYRKPLRTLFSGLQHVRTLDLSGCHPITGMESLRCLGSMGTLETLHDVPVKVTSIRREDFSGFPALRNLSILGGEARDIALFLACVSSPVLTSLDITTRDVLSRCPTIFVDISSKSESLKILVLELLPPEEVDFAEPEQLPMRPFVGHLLKIRALERFHIVVRKSDLLVDDAALEAIAKAWPALTSLALDVPSIGASPTILSLAHFARHCASLHTLILPDMNGRDHIDDFEGNPHPTQLSLRQLSFLHLTYLLIADEVTLARILHSLFPRLDTTASAEQILPQKTVVDDLSDDEAAVGLEDLRDYRLGFCSIVMMRLEEFKRKEIGIPPS